MRSFGVVVFRPKPDPATLAGFQVEIIRIYNNLAAENPRRRRLRAGGRQRLIVSVPLQALEPRPGNPVIIFGFKRQMKRLSGSNLPGTFLRKQADGGGTVRHDAERQALLCAGVGVAEHNQVCTAVRNGESQLKRVFCRLCFSKGFFTGDDSRTFERRRSAPFEFYL